MRICLPLMKNVLTPLAESVLIPLGLLTATSATDGLWIFIVRKNIYGSDMHISDFSTANYIDNHQQRNG